MNSITLLAEATQHDETLELDTFENFLILRKIYHFCAQVVIDAKKGLDLNTQFLQFSENSTHRKT